MFDIGAQELLLVAVVAIIVIGPKDMPAALRAAGRWIGKMRRMSGQFRSGIDSMIREAEMEDMEKKWKAQNEKIMRENPEGGPAEMEQTGAFPSAAPSAKAIAAPVTPDATSAADPAVQPASAESAAKPTKLGDLAPDVTPDVAPDSAPDTGAQDAKKAD